MGLPAERAWRDVVVKQRDGMSDAGRNVGQQPESSCRRRTVGQQSTVAAGIPVIGVRRRRFAAVARIGADEAGRGADLAIYLYRPRRLERLRNRRHEDTQPDGEQAGPDHKFLTADT